MPVSRRIATKYGPCRKPTRRVPLQPDFLCPCDRYRRHLLPEEASAAHLRDSFEGLRGATRPWAASCEALQVSASLRGQGRVGSSSASRHKGSIVPWLLQP